NGGAFLTADGNLSTTARQSLTLGNSSSYNTTGNVLINPNGTGNVGIGTTTPEVQLDVVGNFYLTTQNSGDGIRLYSPDQSKRLDFAWDGGNMVFGATGQSLVLSASDYYFAGGGDITLGGSSLFGTDIDNGDLILDSNSTSNKGDVFINPSGGAVGVGTTTALATLDIRGNSGTTPFASFSGQTAKAGLIIDNNGVGDLFTASKSGATKFVVTNSGDVGIGTSTPGFNLHVVDGDSAGHITIEGYGSTSRGGNFVGRGAQGTVNSPSALLSGDLMTQLSGVGYGDTGFSTTRAAITMNAAENWSDSSQGTSMSFHTTATGSTSIQERMRITTEGDLLLGGTTTSANIDGNGLVAYGAICADDSLDTADDCVDNTRNAGTVYGITSSFTIDDIAENFPTLDSSLEAGDIVMLDYQAKPATADDSYETEFVKKGDTPYGSKLLGAISQKPGVLLGGHGQNNDPRSVKEVAVALSGRIPLKITTQNGSVQPGDLVTASNIAGVGMKATQAGFVIGRALEAYENPDPNAVGKIMVFVNNTWYDPRVQMNDSGNVAVEGKSLSSETLPSS
ncbi:MAG: hypothetical protein ACRD4B_05345, partial [Acidobacteriota bacterium]